MEHITIKRISDISFFHNQIEAAAIKVRKNSDRLTGCCCYPRKIIVLQQLKNFERWKSKVNYGSRWIAETVFSSLKRVFGEYVSAKKFPNMVKEMVLKAPLYNRLLVEI